MENLLVFRVRKVLKAHKEFKEYKVIEVKKVLLAPLELKEYRVKKEQLV